MQRGLICKQALRCAVWTPLVLITICRNFAIQQVFRIPLWKTSLIGLNKPCIKYTIWNQAIKIKESQPKRDMNIKFFFEIQRMNCSTYHSLPQLLHTNTCKIYVVEPFQPNPTHGWTQLMSISGINDSHIDTHVKITCRLKVNTKYLLKIMMDVTFSFNLIFRIWWVSMCTLYKQCISTFKWTWILWLSIFSRTHQKVVAEVQWQHKVVERCNNIVSYEFLWIRRTCDY